jgi:L-iditol 2-dehydrogenase
MTHMRVIVWRGSGQVTLEQREIPAPRPGEALVEIRTNGLCSTDYPIVKGLVEGSWPGMVLGHEPVGVVRTLGRDVTEPEIGQRVVLDTMLACGHCRCCQQGHPELCAHSEEIGFSVDGCWSDFAVLPAANLHVLPDEIDDLEGTMIEALTCQLGAVDALGVGFGETAAIIGSGLAALTFVQLLRLKGAGHIALSMHDYATRIELARTFGADRVVTSDALDAMSGDPKVRANQGFDIVIDAVGTPQTTRTAVSLARRGGKILLYGLRSAVVDGFPLSQMIFDNLTLYGRTSAPWMWDPAIDLVMRGAVRLRSMIGGVIELEDVPELLNQPRGHGGPIKQVIRIRGD